MKFQVMFDNCCCFLFSKTYFWEYKEKKISCIFEIKNMFGQLKLKKNNFVEEKKKENIKICCYQNLNSNTNSLNETDSLNQMHVLIDF